jgi:hypothetical protein
VTRQQEAGQPRAPVGPPLTATAGSTEQEEPGTGGAQVDPLVANGLGSPSCGSALVVEISPAGRRDCETSGFLAAAEPTQNFGIDVHIDTGLLGLGSGELLSLVQDLFIAPVWLAVVWSVHVLLVMLEWSFSLNLFEYGSSHGLQSALAGTLAGFTWPWLPLALSVAAVLFAYQGLVRRRVAQTLGEAAATMAMIAAGIFLTLDPLGTLGLVGRWSDRTALGTMAVAARGTPASPGRTMSEAFGAVFAATVEAPWCYLEFGDVRWCREPSRLDPAVRSAGLRIAGRESSEARCAPGCGSSASSRALAVSARLLREAHTNAAVFLALTPNGPDRNSINDGGSLLRTLCRTAEATDCQGPEAAEAEFRTGGGTWSRVGGLLLICAGLAGMMLLFGTITLRLLLAAMLSVFYLMLAPAVVIAPAFGEAGRSIFRSWASRLLSAVFSKLLYAFLLGVVLALMAMLEQLEIGWWPQWLLVSASWWGLFLRRHSLPAVMSPAATGAPAGEAAAWVARRARRRFDEERKQRRVRRETTIDDRHGGSRRPRSRGPAAPAPVFADRLAQRCVELQSRGESARVAAGARERIGRAGLQLGRIEKARQEAERDGDDRRRTRLELRGTRVRAGLARDRQLLDRLGAEGTGTGAGEDRTGRLQAWTRYLDEQERLPRGVRPGGRDYPGLAGLAGLGRSQYEELKGQRARAARVEIDRALARRRESRDPDRAPGGPRSPVAAERPAERSRPPQRDRVRARVGDRRPAWEESEVLNDIREVAAGRKRQLGIGRP